MSKTRAQRKQIAKSTHTTMKEKNCRFIKLDFADSYLFEVLDETKAMSKNCQDLRNGQPRTRHSIDQSSEHALKSYDSFLKDEPISSCERLPF